MGVRPRRKAQLQKKTLIAAEQDRPDVARRRAQWTKYRERIDLSRLVFIDESVLQTTEGVQHELKPIVSCGKDGGWPPEIGFQERVSNQSELLR